MFESGSIICASTNEFSVIGKLTQVGGEGIALIGLSKEEIKESSQLTFFKIGKISTIDEGMGIVIPREKIVIMSTGVKTNVSPR